MRAVVIEAPGTITVQTIADPTPERHDVVVAVAGCGICGTDTHLVDGLLPGVPYPLVPGHEFFGTVVEVGADIHTLTVGDHVAVDPNLPCGHCRQCGAGRGNLCENYRALGVTMAGACAEFVAVPRTSCYRLPDSYPLSAAALIEPMSCVIHGVDRLPQRPTDRYLVIGAGTVGLMMAAVLSDVATAPVAVVDVNPDRVSAASELGFNAAATIGEHDTADWDTVIDCTGVPAAIESALGVVTPGGTLQLFGVATPDAAVSISPYDVYRREISIIGSMAVHESFGRAIPMVASHLAIAEHLVSDRFGLDEYAAALERFRTGRSLKIVIEPGR